MGSNRLRRILFAGALGLSGCAAPPPPAVPPVAAPPVPEAAPAPPEKEAVATGSDCAKAQAQCGGGVCVLSIDNACAQAVSCDATMVTTCKSGHEMVEAARRKRETFAAGTAGEISLQGNCPSGEILRTAVQSIACK